MVVINITRDFDLDQVADIELRVKNLTLNSQQEIYERFNFKRG